MIIDKILEFYKHKRYTLYEMATAETREYPGNCPDIIIWGFSDLLGAHICPGYLALNERLGSFCLKISDGVISK